ncbi:hypothetical protein RF11_13063 [Thelohanellus kitauei]|uniref:Uncharacterized protein n=1 Tax=Thelohanellus kitauei TaxID=669202 RepID=A0A0C2N7D5_THEKT|nr:hypothetical protein RF11_13063 [Thelohanellus kitauei]
MMEYNPNRRIFKKEWEEIFPITQVESDPYSFYCVPCAQKYSCRNSGISNVRAHCQSLRHTRNVAARTFSDAFSESAEGKLLRKSTSGDIRLKISLPSRNKSEICTLQSRCDGFYIAKELEMLENSYVNPKEVKFETIVMNDASKVKDFFEKYKRAYRMDTNFEMDPDLHRAMRQYFNQIFKRVNEESEFLGYVLTRLENIKK